MDPDRAERIAKGVSLVVDQGRSYREAGAIVGIPHRTLYDHAAQLQTEPEAVADRIRRRAVQATEQAVERMADEIDTVDPKHLASWTHTAARIGGLLESHSDSKASDLAELLQRLTQGGNTVSLGVRVEPTHQSLPDPEHQR